MCSTPKMPSVATTNTQTEVAAPTYADAKTSKATSVTRNKATALAGRDIKTSARGLSDDAKKEKNNLLGA